MPADPQQLTPERECITCGKCGHWYLHCPVQPFTRTIADAFGLGPLMDDIPAGTKGSAASKEKSDEQ